MQHMGSLVRNVTHTRCRTAGFPGTCCVSSLQQLKEFRAVVNSVSKISVTETWRSLTGVCKDRKTLPIIVPAGDRN